MPVENIVGERSSTDFGMDFGGGMNFGAVYAELRYHYIWGPEVETSSTGGNRYAGVDPPIPKGQRPVPGATFGFRF